MTIHARLATVVAAVALLVGVSAATGAVAGSLVTSRDIKDGTIQSKDLDTQIRASLQKGSTALRSVPNNSVTSATVRNGSLRLSDIATVVRTQGFTPQVFPADACVQTAPVDTGHPTSGALVFVQTTLPSDYTISGQPGSSADDIVFTVCGTDPRYPDYAADGANGDDFTWELFAN